MEQIQKYDFKEGLPQELEILELNQLISEFKDEITTPHRAEFYQIIWFQKGNSTHMIDFNHVEIKPNTLLFINKNSVQQFDKSCNFDGKIILFTDAFFCKEEADTKFLKSTILFNDLLSISSVYVPNLSSILNELLLQIEIESKNIKDEYQSDILRNSLKNMLFISERERKKQGFIEIKKGADLDIVMQFKNELEQYYYKEKGVLYYADVLHITKKRLNKATSIILESTPKNIIDARIILEAKRLLVHTKESVKEISFALGFEEPTNFIKYFKKHQKTTPLEFRENFIN